MLFNLALVAALSTVVVAAPHDPKSSQPASPAQPQHSGYTCTDFIAPITVTNAQVVIPPDPPLADGYAAVDFALTITARDFVPPETQTTTLTKTFDIAFSYCVPNSPNANTQTLHLMTHGIGFNRSYWDFYAPGSNDPQYSYMASITGAGYSGLSYNRVGHTPSSPADPYTEWAGFVELAVLTQITTLVRAGSLSGVAVPSTVIHVGHSYGSVLSSGLAATSPDLTDGIVLTGYSLESQYQNLWVASTSLHLINENQPARFPPSQYNNGFLTWPDKYANQYGFFAYPYFDINVLIYGESVKWPLTVGQLLTLNEVPAMAPGFTKPVLYVIGEKDLIFCASQCNGLFGPDSKTLSAYPDAPKEVSILPNIGHGINLHYNASAGYDTIIDWAGRNFA